MGLPCEQLTATVPSQVAGATSQVAVVSQLAPPPSAGSTQDNPALAQSSSQSPCPWHDSAREPRHCVRPIGQVPTSQILTRAKKMESS